MIRCLAGARPGAKPRRDIDYRVLRALGAGLAKPSPAAPRQPERSGVFREGLPNRRVLASLRLSHTSYACESRPLLL